MSDVRRYKVTDDRFGRLALTLREKASLTQAEVASAVGVSERTIRYWEDGTTFPTGANLRQLIGLYLRHGAFTPGRERDEATALWAQADESARRRKALFDGAWFEGLLDRPPPAQPQPAAPAAPRAQHADWGEAPDAAALIGRDQQLAELGRWVVAERCRVVALLGIGGIGKTTLAVRLAQAVAPQFEAVIWRSLRNAPPLAELLADCLPALASGPSPERGSERSLSLLIACLRQRRCLLVLDNVETVLEAGSLAGRYRAGYEDYRQLFQRVAESAHQSCLLLTSREMLSDLEPIEGPAEPVRAMPLFGLLPAASLALLQDKGLTGTSEVWGGFVQHYAGNPLALKIAAATVRSLFGGDLAAFLQEGPVLHHTMQQLLDDQFGRLAPVERDLVAWLAIEREPVSIDALSANFLRAPSRRELLAALEALRRRSLLERAEGGIAFTLQPVVLEYVSDWLVAQAAEEIVAGSFGLLAKYALFKAQSRDYIRDSQLRMLVQPLLSRLLTHYGDTRRVEQALLQLLGRLRAEPIEGQGYAAGNLVNLLVGLRGELRGADLTRLALRQADLQGVDAQGASLAFADAGDVRFTEPIETIIAMAVSPDGAYMAVGSFSGQIRLWQVADGRPAWSVRGHSRTAWALAFSPDGSALASGGYRGKVRVWEVATGRCLVTLAGHRAWVRSVAFSPAAPLLASAGDDGTVRLWELADGSCRQILEGHSGRISSVAFSPDGALLLTGGNDRSVRVWEVASGRCLHLLRRHHDSVFTIAVHPDGVLVVSGDEAGTLNLWDAPRGQWLAALHSRSGGLSALVFNHDGSLLAGGTNDGIVELWDVERRATRAYFEGLHEQGTIISSVAFTPAGLAASVSRGGNVKLWEPSSGRVIRTIQGYSSLITTLGFSPDGRLLAQGDDNGLVRVWDTATSRCLWRAQVQRGPIWALAWSPDGTRLASGGDGQLRVWEGQSGRALHNYGKQDSITWALAYSPDGAVLAGGGGERRIKLWPNAGGPPSGQPVVLAGTSDHIVSLAFSASGRLLASGHRDGSVGVWETASGHCLHSLHHAHSPVGALCFADEGSLLSAGDSLIVRWELASGRRCATTPLASGRGWFKGMAIDAGGQLLALGDDDQTLWLWRIAGQPEPVAASFGGHSAQIWAVAISPDGKTLASSDDSGTVILRDSATGEELRRIAPDRPYERMQIQGMAGLNAAQRAALIALGAVEEPA